MPSERTQGHLKSWCYREAAGADDHTSVLSSPFCGCGGRETHPPCMCRIIPVAAKWSESDWCLPAAPILLERIPAYLPLQKMGEAQGCEGLAVVLLCRTDRGDLAVWWVFSKSHSVLRHSRTFSSTAEICSTTMYFWVLCLKRETPPPYLLSVFADHFLNPPSVSASGEPGLTVQLC